MKFAKYFSVVALHSRGLCAAPRFSPTRFIPPSFFL